MMHIPTEPNRRGLPHSAGQVHIAVQLCRLFSHSFSMAEGSAVNELRSTKYAICVVDDEADEMTRARRYLGSHFEVGTGKSVDLALDDLQGKIPDLFLIDMYFPEGPVDVPDPITFLHEARAEYLKAENKFVAALAKVRQNPAGGFKEANLAKKRHPSVPVVFFTRKGTLDNAIRAYENERAAGVLKKPDPSPQMTLDAAPGDLPRLYDEAFDSEAEVIAGKLKSKIIESKWLSKNRALVWSAVISFAAGFASSLLAMWFAG